MGFDWGHGVELSFDVYKDFDVEVSNDFNMDVDNDSDWYIDSDVKSEVCLDGNVANFNIDVQAFGYDTYTEVNLTALTQANKYSSITVSGTSAAD